MMDLSRYQFEKLREDEEFALFRGRSIDGDLPTILLASPVSEHPVSRTLERLEHAYSLRDEPASNWAVRPLALTQRESQPMLRFEAAGGETLDRLLGQRMDIGRLLRWPVGLATAAG